MAQAVVVLRRGEARAAGLDPARLERAFAVVERFVASGRIPGAVAAVARRGHLFGPRAYGFAALEPERVPLAADTLFDLASVTKVTATLPAVLLLLERGEIRLDDPVHLFIPEFFHEAPGEKADRLQRSGVTLRHLLTHTSGLPAWKDLYSRARTPADVVAAICRTPLEYQTGQKVVYSCLGFILLGEVVARVSGRSLDRFVAEEIFAPLGLRATTFIPPAAGPGRIAATEAGVPVGVVHDENARAMGGVSGNAGLFGPAAELAVYGQMWLNGGTYGGQRLLSPATVRLATRNHTAHLNEGRGLGWVVKGDDRYSSAGDLFSPHAYGHTGFTGTSLWIDPERDLLAVLLTNRVHPTRQNQAHLRLRPLFHNAVAAAAL